MDWTWSKREDGRRKVEDRRKGGDGKGLKRKEGLRTMERE